MDELLDKYLKGEIADDSFNQELSKLSEDDKKKFDEKLASLEIQKQLSDKGKELLDKVVALRKENKRLEDKGGEGQKDYTSKLRDENVEKASEIFFKKYNIPQEERQHYRDAFKTNDSGHVNVDLILNDFNRIYAVEHSDELLKIKDEYDGLKEGSDEFNASHAGAPGGSGGGGGEGGPTFSPQVHEWVKASAKKGIKISLEKAKEILESTNRGGDGMTRTF